MSGLGQETIYYLEMTTPSAHLPKLSDDPSFCVRVIDPPNFKKNQQFYLEVGQAYSWHERRNWSQADWSQYALQPNLVTYVASAENKEIGYFELFKLGGDVELIYFGLLPEAVGLGYGSAMLSQAIQCAWGLLKGVEAARLWVHTCNFDHPNALGNYQRSGFTLYKTETLGG